jgi:hypothetical protein
MLGQRFDSWLSKKESDEKLGQFIEVMEKTKRTGRGGKTNSTT